MKSGTLLLLVMARPFPRVPYPYAAALAVCGAPQGCVMPSDWHLEDMELGDEDCKPLPTLIPNEHGLWLLRWAWEEYPSRYDEEGTTVRYADSCEWVRPTVEDLALLNALPSDSTTTDTARAR